MYACVCLCARVGKGAGSVFTRLMALGWQGVFIAVLCSVGPTVPPSGWSLDSREGQVAGHRHLGIADRSHSL